MTVRFEIFPASVCFFAKHITNYSLLKPITETSVQRKKEDCARIAK